MSKEEVGKLYTEFRQLGPDRKREVEHALIFYVFGYFDHPFCENCNLTFDDAQDLVMKQIQQLVTDSKASLECKCGPRRAA